MKLSLARKVADIVEKIDWLEYALKTIPNPKFERRKRRLKELKKELKG